VAEPTYRAAVARWPRARITLAFYDAQRLPVSWPGGLWDVLPVFLVVAADNDLE
jgi:hypothetical protein